MSAKQGAFAPAAPQKQCACAARATCPACGVRQLQRKAVPGAVAAPGAVPAVVEEVLSEPGVPLPPAERVFMEGRFGHDFGQVRVHADARAARSAAAVSALAYTVGRDVVFGAGRFAPGTAPGRALLAHELAHVIQQGRGGAAPAPDPSGPLEMAADRAAAEVARGSGPVPVGGAAAIGLSRKDDEKNPKWWKRVLNPVYQTAREKLPPAASELLGRANDAARTFVEGHNLTDQQINGVVAAAAPVVPMVQAGLDALPSPQPAPPQPAKPVAVPIAAPAPKPDPAFQLNVPPPGAKHPEIADVILPDPRRVPAAEMTTDRIDAYIDLYQQKLAYLKSPFAAPIAEWTKNEQAEVTARLDYLQELRKKDEEQWQLARALLAASPQELEALRKKVGGTASPDEFARLVDTITRRARPKDQAEPLSSKLDALVRRMKKLGPNDYISQPVLDALGAEYTADARAFRAKYGLNSDEFSRVESFLQGTRRVAPPDRKALAPDGVQVWESEYGAYVQRLRIEAIRPGSGIGTVASLAARAGIGAARLAGVEVSDERADQIIGVAGATGDLAETGLSFAPQRGYFKSLNPTPARTVNPHTDAAPRKPAGPVLGQLGPVGSDTFGGAPANDNARPPAPSNVVPFPQVQPQEWAQTGTGGWVLKGPATTGAPGGTAPDRAVNASKPPGTKAPVVKGPGVAAGGTGATPGPVRRSAPDVLPPRPAWRPGKPVTQATPDGEYPSWTVIRERYWMSRAARAAPGEFGPSNLGAMRGGYAPSARAVVRDNRTGEVRVERVVKELHHHRGGRGQPGFDEPLDIRELWPWEHEALDPDRKTGYTFLRFSESL